MINCHSRKEKSRNVDSAQPSHVNLPHKTGLSTAILVKTKMEAIPVINLFKEPSEKLGVSQAIKNLGFLALKSPDEPTTSQISELFRISQEFFENESTEEKERCAITIENKGWVKKRQER